ncbi:MAG: Gfo/Idh/MocA family oxidoreductase [Ruminococcus sp.]|nr:Gfo/Idh/MocA family oxidoreductase [Ruminococcus sp.]
MNIGILGAGGIARTMAATVAEMNDTKVLAIGSRTLEKAQEFAAEFDIPTSYGSYEELAADDRLDLIYIATPHSRHFEDCMICIQNGRNVLCEKAFTANKKQAEELFKTAKEKNVFICEAIWTRFIPMRKTLDDILKSGIIGEITSLTANLGYPISHLDRLVKPELAGGALLDLGVYTLNFAVMALGKDIADIKSVCTKNEYGVDMHNSIILTYSDGKTALLHSNCQCALDRKGIIYGTKGRIEFHNINNCEGIDVILNNGIQKHYPTPPQISGYEYEVIASLKAISEGKKQCDEMTHEETLFIMEIMDKLRSDWGIIYPFE